jgi:lysophospholipase L1-like esterase
MKLVQVILITITAFAGCKKSGGNLTVAKTDTAKTKMITGPFTYLALGDSYTIGQSVLQSDSYPYQLTGSLNAGGFKVQLPTIIATTGWTTDNLINAISQSNIHNNIYDFVTLLIGVNDQYQGLSMDNYKIKFAQVLNTAIGFAKGDASRVFVLSIPDWGVTPFGKGRESEVGPQIDAFNAINEAISHAAGVHYLNITGISKQAATDLSLVADDGLHPSGKMYSLWVQWLEPLVTARLKK